MLNLDDGTVDQVALVEDGEGAIDHGVEIGVGNLVELDDGRILDFGQNGPLSKMFRGPFVTFAVQYIPCMWLLGSRRLRQTCLGGQ